MATSYLSPGVYVEEVDRGSKPLEMVGTSTVGFIGECDVGPVNEAIFCTNWSTYTKHFGDFQQSEYMAHAVYGFFNNGGGRCFVLNVKPGEGAEEKKVASKAAWYIGSDNGPGTRTGSPAKSARPGSASTSVSPTGTSGSSDSGRPETVPRAPAPPPITSRPPRRTQLSSAWRCSGVNEELSTSFKIKQSNDPSPAARSGNSAIVRSSRTTGRDVLGTDAPAIKDSAPRSRTTSPTK